MIMRDETSNYSCLHAFSFDLNLCVASFLKWGRGGGGGGMDEALLLRDLIIAIVCIFD